jgi:hypothetical protein
VDSIIDTNGARPERASRRRLDLREARDDYQIRCYCHENTPGRPSSVKVANRRDTFSSFHPSNPRRDEVDLRPTGTAH